MSETSGWWTTQHHGQFHLRPFGDAVMELVSADLPGDGWSLALVRPYLPKPPREGVAAVGRASVPVLVRLQLTGPRNAVGQMLALF